MAPSGRESYPGLATKNIRQEEGQNRNLIRVRPDDWPLSCLINYVRNHGLCQSRSADAAENKDLRFRKRRYCQDRTARTAYLEKDVHLGKIYFSSWIRAANPEKAEWQSQPQIKEPKKILCYINIAMHKRK